MPLYFCREDEMDAEDEWTKLVAMDSEDAVLLYAEMIDDRSAGEAFTDPAKDEVLIHVRMDGSEVSMRYKVSFDYHKRFYPSFA